MSEETKRKISLSKKGSIPWNKGIKTGIIPKTAFKKGNIPWCKKVKGMGLMKAWNKGLKFPQLSGENHFAWKGENVSYRNLHRWVESLLGKPHKCDECGNQTLKHRQYSWANISGNYKRIISDWRRLCMKCHKAFDISRVMNR